MDFRFSQEEEQFRRELREFYGQELPPDWLGGEDERETSHQIIKGIRQKLANKGWLTMAWPREYGGQDATMTKQLVFAEESAYHRFMAREQGVGFLGPAIIQHGTDEQKRRFLPGISRAELAFHQGFSEPDAGSDLAGLTTRAVRDGDEYVINGQKIWGGNLRFADYSFLLARTNQDAPKHKGLSLLIIPAKTPGLRYEEFGNLGGGLQNVAYYDSCRVPIKDSLIGEENQGWYVAMSVLNHERVVVEYGAIGRRLAEDLLKLYRANRHQDPGIDLVIRHKLAEYTIESNVAKNLAYRIAWMEGAGQHATYEASIFKIFGGEMMQRFAQAGMEMLGLYGQVHKEESRKELRRLNGYVEWLYRYSRAYSIIGGANEIQRGVIANRGLGLPRS